VESSRDFGGHGANRTGFLADSYDMSLMVNGWGAAAIGIAPAYGAIGWWTLGYGLLSLSLAVIWIALVSFGRFCQRRRELLPVRPTRPRLPSVIPGFRHWQRENEEFSRQLALLEAELGATCANEGNNQGNNQGNTAAPGIEAVPPPRVES